MESVSDHHPDKIDSLRLAGGCPTHTVRPHESGSSSNSPMSFVMISFLPTRIPRFHLIGTTGGHTMSALQELGRQLGLQGGGSAEVLKEVLGMLQGKDGKGLQELLQGFQQRGLGDAVASWVGNGANQPVSPEQVNNVMGDRVSQWADQLGLPKDVVSKHLSQLLPSLIDRLTPNGRMPEPGQVEAAVDKYIGE